MAPALNVGDSWIRAHGPQRLFWAHGPPAETVSKVKSMRGWRQMRGGSTKKLEQSKIKDPGVGGHLGAALT